MRWLICSDIHGDLDSAERIISACKNEGCDRILILGDILYHGPRNDLPSTYAPKKVIELLNEYRENILTVRGNCDTEVDAMVLKFPILAEYAYLFQDGLNIFITHGHIHNTLTPPPLRQGELLLHGHTHIPAFEKFGNENYYINPGSAAIPKGGHPRSYMTLEGRTFTLKDIFGNTLNEYKL